MLSLAQFLILVYLGRECKPFGAGKGALAWAKNQIFRFVTVERPPPVCGERLTCDRGLQGDPQAHQHSVLPLQPGLTAQLCLGLAAVSALLKLSPQQ